MTNEITYSELIYRYLDNAATDTQRFQLYKELAGNEDLQLEFEDALKIKKASVVHLSNFVPSASLTEGLFKKIGNGNIVVPVTSGKSSFTGLASILKSKYAIGILSCLTGIIATIFFYSLVQHPSFQASSFQRSALERSLNAPRLATDVVSGKENAERSDGIPTRSVGTRKNNQRPSFQRSALERSTNAPRLTTDSKNHVNIVNCLKNSERSDGIPTRSVGTRKNNQRPSFQRSALECSLNAPRLTTDSKNHVNIANCLKNSECSDGIPTRSVGTRAQTVGTSNNLQLASLNHTDYDINFYRNYYGGVLNPYNINYKPENDKIINPQESLLDSHKFQIQISGRTGLAYFPNRELFNFYTPVLNNGVIALNYELDEHNSIGLTCGQETFPMYVVSNDLNYMPNQTMTWFGGVYAYTFDRVFNNIKLNPYAQLIAAGSKNGFVLKPTLGLSWIPEDRVKFSLGIEETELLYKFQNKINSTRKFSVMYGVAVTF